ncbi:MAG: Gfo/Idh/MocA family oxidoreductase [Clostridia bacterium]|nr:Gfo/Idh/MocA family oxidoreductase [Clostridia bacterium]
MKKVRIGVFGGFRGASMIKYARIAENAELVAVCDKLPEVIEKQKELCGDQVAYYDNFEDFIKHDMDAVILANYANEHAPYAIRCMKAGKHVFSEVLPVQTMKEAVELVEAVEETGMIYAYGENYCYMPGPYEMRRLYLEGKMGEFEYGEGEYIHNCESIWHNITYGDRDHWRNNMYSTFYCTHSLGPIIHITGLRPVKVTGYEGLMNERNLRVGCKPAQYGIEMVEFENGGIAKSIHGGLYKGSVWYSLYGSHGRMETVREDADIQNMVKRLYTNFDDCSGAYDTTKKQDYIPVRDMDDVAKDFGHGQSDFYTMYHFVRKIQGYEDADIIDVYEALDMFLPGLWAYRSILAGGIPMEIPNLRDKAERDKWRNDTLCTDKKVAGDQWVPSSSKGDVEIPDEVYENMRNKWLKK